MNILGLGLPMGQSPDGNIQIMRVPLTVLRTQMDKDTAIESILKLQAVVDQLPDPQKPSDIIVAKSMSGVDQAAQDINRFRG